MMMDKRSEAALVGVKPALVAIVRRAHELTQDRMTGIDFIVTEGLRSVTRQAQLVQAGASRTMKSRHLIGEAVDLAAVVGGEVRWDWSLYAILAEDMKAAANELGHVITWGGDWTSFKDGPHFQIEEGAKA